MIEFDGVNRKFEKMILEGELLKFERLIYVYNRAINEAYSLDDKKMYQHAIAEFEKYCEQIKYQLGDYEDLSYSFEEVEAERERARKKASTLSFEVVELKLMEAQKKRQLKNTPRTEAAERDALFFILSFISEKLADVREMAQQSQLALDNLRDVAEKSRMEANNLERLLKN